MSCLKELLTLFINSFSIHQVPQVKFEGHNSPALILFILPEGTSIVYAFDIRTALASAVVLP